MPLEDIYTKFPNYWQGSNNGLMQPLPLNTPIVYFSKFEGWVKDNDKYQAVCDKMLNESKYGSFSNAILAGSQKGDFNLEFCILLLPVLWHHVG